MPIELWILDFWLDAFVISELRSRSISKWQRTTGQNCDKTIGPVQFDADIRIAPRQDQLVDYAPANALGVASSGCPQPDGYINTPVQSIYQHVAMEADFDTQVFPLQYYIQLEQFKLKVDEFWAR